MIQIYAVYKRTMRSKDINKLKWKGWERIFHANTTQSDLQINAIYQNPNDIFFYGNRNTHPKIDVEFQGTLNSQNNNEKE